MAMQKSRARVRHLTALLIKDEFKKPEDCLKDVSAVEKVELSARLSYSADFYLQAKKARSPPWMEFLETIVAKKLPTLKNQNVCGVFFVRLKKRIVAFTQGHGRNLLRADCFERDFGLKVVLNSVDPTQLRSVDARKVEDLTTQTRKQLSRNSPMDAFALNLNQDILRVIAGKPKSEEFAKLIVGSDSLSLSAKVEVEQLGEKSEELFAAYQSQEYKKHFPWFDHLRSVRDQAVMGELNRRLIEKIQAGSADALHLATPEVIDWSESSGLSFSTEADPTPRHDLLMEDYLKTKDETVSVADLKRDHVQVHFGAANAPVSKWSVYDSIVFEAEEKGEVFVLSGGDWFRVAKRFADEVRDRVGTIKKSTLILPAAKSTDREDDYNFNVAKSRGFILMDKKNSYVAEGKTSIEVCDLLTKDRQFVHVKRKTRSSTLSHLFSQGVVSADAFWMDQEFRNHARNHVLKIHPTLKSLIPQERPNPAEFEVVFAVITKSNPKWPHSLPFFSQLNLSYAHDRLERMGYRVSLLRIDEV
ncbi:DUF6119 family protein [Myxococcus sp. CA039A]|uniref:DUF6119 family protein n=1 Tax=Myxococcus sp. CA039A TaxID=2741737 RepID=UPI00157B769C|nr:DUF6119 family protein [Myxococcus sp. CA039A]NTX56169.1 TIGR04141 family sporadically distributed protein [Myxococcus sp. CA039A]